jgi:hypothetical protein
VRVRLLTAGLLGAVVVLATGCSADKAPITSPAPDQAPVASAPPRQEFDPPTRFDTAGFAVGAGRSQDVLLYAGTAFVGGETAITTTDMVTGKPIGSIAPVNPPVQRPGGLGAPVGHTPALVQRPGQGPVVVVPYPVDVPASGTTAARQAVELIVVDAATGQKKAVLTVDAAPADGGFAAEAGEYASVIGS